jgi:putative hydrolase of the HAD superfamily
MPASKAVIFDCGGVLFDFEQDRRLAAISHASGLAPDEVQARIWDSGLDAAADRGEIPLDALCRRLNEVLEINMDEGHLVALMIRAFTVKPDVLSLVRQLRPEVIRGTLTNNGPLIRLGLERHFPDLVAVIPQHRYFSYQFGRTKPNRAIYEAVAVKLGLPGPDIFFLDDSEKNVAGAREAGWRAMRFTGADELSVELHGMELLSA